MKNSTTNPVRKPKAPLFQDPAQPVDSPTGKPATSLTKTPLADLMLHPEKVATVLEVTKVGDPTPAPSPAKGARRSRTSPKRDGDDPEKTSRRSLVNTAFQFDAPLAGSVKLAGDFTRWEMSPLDLIKSADGVWHVAVPLPPGDHAYRFIVDGEWRDDPHPTLSVPNPYGTVNGVVRVT